MLYHWLLYGAAPLISLLSGLYIGTCISLCLAAVHSAHPIPSACIQKLCLLLTADSSLLLTQRSKLCEIEAYQIEGNLEPKPQIEINVRFAHMCTKTVPSTQTATDKPTLIRSVARGHYSCGGKRQLVWEIMDRTITGEKNQCFILK